MDHNNLKQKNEGHTHCQCPHGMCQNHDPEWEKVGKEKRVPNPYLGIKTYWTMRCCGKTMARYMVVQTKRCKKCGRIKDFVENYNLALCLCCGNHTTIMPDCY